MTKQLTFEIVESQPAHQAIWVINTSEASDAGQPGDLHIGIPKLNGSRVDLVNVMQTWLPQELTRQVPRTQLLASSEFRSAVNNNLLAMISEEDALRIRRREGASEENQRLQSLRTNQRRASAARTISDSGAEVVNTNTLKGGSVEINSSHGDNTALAALRGIDEVEPGIAPKFKMWVDRLSTMSDIQTMNEIRSRKKFSTSELRYLFSEVASKEKSHALVARNLRRKK